jgi:hypothetical protein
MAKKIKKSAQASSTPPDPKLSGSSGREYNSKPDTGDRKRSDH